MKDYLLNVMEKRECGLYLCELPTGNGKTFDSAQAMKKYADSIEDNTKIIYLTTLNKNLPEDALKAAYGSRRARGRNGGLFLNGKTRRIPRRYAGQYE